MSRLLHGTGILIVVLAAAGPGQAQNMAFTPPAPLARPAPAEAPKRPDPPLRPASHSIEGELPNQRTGPARNRVVRDICIGCDR